MKYRLIKRYPGSPRLGTIIYESAKQFYEYKKSCTPILKIDLKTISEFPEFWEPVNELEEQILEIINNQIILDGAYSLCRHNPERAAKQIMELIKDKLK